jgi:hypothetical protein
MKSFTHTHRRLPGHPLRSTIRLTGRENAPSDLFKDHAGQGSSDRRRTARHRVGLSRDGGPGYQQPAPVSDPLERWVALIRVRSCRGAACVARARHHGTAARSSEVAMR